MFEVAFGVRRVKPSHGFRAVHVTVQSTEISGGDPAPKELQHAWAELSEKMADGVGTDARYGGKPALIPERPNLSSRLVASFEQHLDIDGRRDEHVDEHKR